VTVQASRVPLAPRWLTGLTVRVTVLAGFAVLAVATLGLLLITAATPLWLIAAILTGRSVAVGLVITPLLQALVQPLRPDQLGDANTLFNTWQRIAGSFGIGLVAALYATRAPQPGPGGRPALGRPGPGRDRRDRRAGRACPSPRGVVPPGITATRARGAVRPRAMPGRQSRTRAS
jgi:hypothetical protein